MSVTHFCHGHTHRVSENSIPANLFRQANPVLGEGLALPLLALLGSTVIHNRCEGDVLKGSMSSSTANQPIGARILVALKDRVDSAHWSPWLESIEFIESSAGLLVEVPSTLHSSFLQQRYMSLFKDVVSDVFGDGADRGSRYHSIKISLSTPSSLAHPTSSLMRRPRRSLTTLAAPTTRSFSTGQWAWEKPTCYRRSLIIFATAASPMSLQYPVLLLPTSSSPTSPR